MDVQGKSYGTGGFLPASSNDYHAPPNKRSDIAPEDPHVAASGSRQAHPAADHYALYVQSQGQSELGAASEDIQVQNLTTWQDLLRCQCSKAKLWRFFVRHTRDMWLLVFMGVLAGLFTINFKHFRRGMKYELVGTGLPVAKGFALCIQVLSACVMLMMCRRSISWISQMMQKRPKSRCLRSMLSWMLSLWRLSPSTHALPLHMALGCALLAAAIGHAVAHFVNIAREANSTQVSQGSIYKRWVSVSGVLLLFVTLIIVGFPALTRRHSRFEVFQYSHFVGFVIYLALLVVHPLPGLPRGKFSHPDSTNGNSGGWTWCFVAIPIVLYLAENFKSRLVAYVWLVMIKACGAQHCLGSTWARPVKCMATIHALAPTQSSPKMVVVTFKARETDWIGKYVFICVPALGWDAWFQWHPFSVARAGHENGEYIVQLDIKTKAPESWTARLAAHVQPRGNGMHGEFAAAIHGPLDAPSQNYKGYKVVLLVAAGSGGAPMKSIFLSTLEEVLAIGPNAQVKHEPPRQVHFYWKLADWKTLKLYAQQISHLLNGASSTGQPAPEPNTKFYITFILTRDSENIGKAKVWAAQASTANGVTVEVEGTSALTGIRGLRTQTEFVAVCNRVKERMRSDMDIWREGNDETTHCTVGVFACGPPAGKPREAGKARETTKTQESFWSSWWDGIVCTSKSIGQMLYLAKQGEPDDASMCSMP